MTIQKLQELETLIYHAIQSIDYIRTNSKDQIREEACEAIGMLHRAFESIESEVEGLHTAELK